MTENNIIFVVGRRGLVGLFVILYNMSTSWCQGTGDQIPVEAKKMGKNVKMYALYSFVRLDRY